jgi:hypothetical protein
MVSITRTNFATLSLLGHRECTTKGLIEVCYFLEFERRAYELFSTETKSTDVASARFQELGKRHEVIGDNAFLLREVILADNIRNPRGLLLSRLDSLARAHHDLFVAELDED